MSEIRKEHIILLILVVVIILGGFGLMLWQNMNRKVIISGIGQSGEMVVEEEGDKPEINRNDNDSKHEKEKKVEKKIVIHVAGEVKKSGVYELPEDSRVIDAVIAAGGETGKADLDKMNLAAPICDGEKIYVPSFIDDSSGQSDSNVSGQTYVSSGDGKINLNRASAEELQKLSGIGPSKAESIVDYRKEQGGFSEIEELLEVKGIGEKTLENIKDKLTVR